MGVMPIDLAGARSALAEAGAATSRLLRSAPNPGLPVPGLEWTMRETALHLVGALAAFTATAAGSATVVPRTGGGRTKQRVAELNAMTVGEDPNATSEELAARIEQGVSAFVDATVDRPGGDRLATPWYRDDHSLELDSATCLLLAEQLVHGYDLARAARQPWPIQPAQARLAVHGAVAMMPLFVNPQTTAHLRASYDVAIRGGPRFAVMIDHGAARTAAAPSGRTDCHVSAEPVAFLLLCFGRKSQWGLIARGRMFAWGRKPWLGLRLKNLFLDP